MSRDAVVQIGQHLRLPASKIYGVATFYNQFRFQPQGRNHVQVCRGTACHVKGSAAILDAVKRELKIDAGQTSRDGEFSLEVVACIGACGLAPVICVNGEFHAGVTTKSVGKILELLPKKGARSMTATKLPELLSWIVDGETADPAVARQHAERLAELRRDDVSRPTIFVGAGTCGLGAGAKETLAAMHQYLDNHEIKADVVMVGCIGLCSLEPMVDIQLPGRTRVCFKQITAARWPPCSMRRWPARSPTTWCWASIAARRFSLGPTCPIWTSIPFSRRKPAGCWPIAA